jgi:FkbM family methyltransferase
MFQFQGIWFPDGERHMPDWMEKNGEIIDGRGSYQIRKWRACEPWIKQWRCAVDVGAHVGLWSMQMAKRFKWIYAFEPVQQFRDCYRKNVIEGNLSLEGAALGSFHGRVSMAVDPTDTGGTHAVPGDGTLLRTLDSFNFDEVDFIKVDCEGYELEVLKGAVETLERCKPCVIVEQKQHIMGRNYGTAGIPAVDFLVERGAVIRKHVSGDWILSWL